MKVASIVLVLTLCLLTMSSSVFAAKSIIFLHHSVGDDLITRGGVRESLTSLGYDFYDHGYNDAGLRLANGDYANRNFAVPDDNTEPSGYAAIFSQPLTSPPSNTFSYLMQYDVIIFKSCFSASGALMSDEQLAEYKSDYITIRERMRQFPDKVFIVLSPPPNVPADTSPETAARARAFANWLKSSAFTDNLPNLFVFDLFDAFADSSNVLKAGYRQSEYDSHPSEAADRTIAPAFVSFIDQSIRNARTTPRTTTISSINTATPAPGSTTQTTQSQQESSNANSSVTPGLITDFESDITTEEWRASHGERDAAGCSPAETNAHSGTRALRFQYTLAENGWAHCGHAFTSMQNFGGSSGLSLWLRSDAAAPTVTVNIFTGDHENPTDYEANLDLPPGSAGAWIQVRIPWSEFTLVPSGAGNEAEIVDAQQVQRLGFTATGSTGETVTVWIDDVSIFNGAIAASQQTSQTPGQTQAQGTGTSQGASQLPGSSNNGQTGQGHQVSNQENQGGQPSAQSETSPSKATEPGPNNLLIYGVVAILIVVGLAVLIPRFRKG